MPEDTIPKGPPPPQGAVWVSQRERFAKAFTEWERRFREEPDKFMSEQEHLAESANSIGELSAEYFIVLLSEIA